MAEPQRQEVLKNALDHYILKIRLLIEGPGTLPTHLKSEVLNRDLENESEKTTNVKDNLNKPHSELGGSILDKRDNRELLCRALKCYVIDLKDSVDAVKEKLGGGDPKFDQVRAEIDVATRAIQDICAILAA